MMDYKEFMPAFYVILTFIRLRHLQLNINRLKLIKQIRIWNENKC